MIQYTYFGLLLSRVQMLLLLLLLRFYRADPVIN